MKKSDDNITVYYDGQCPMCSFEIDHLKKADKTNKIRFEDIKADNFSERHPELDIETLDALLHVKDTSGKWIKGLDANYLMWKTVGFEKWLAPLKWQWLRPIANPLYRGFAKHRHTIASLLFRKKHTLSKQAERHHE